MIYYDIVNHTIYYNMIWCNMIWRVIFGSLGSSSQALLRHLQGWSESALGNHCQLCGLGETNKSSPTPTELDLASSAVSQLSVSTQSHACCEIVAVLHVWCSTLHSPFPSRSGSGGSSRTAMPRLGEQEHTARDLTSMSATIFPMPEVTTDRDRQLHAISAWSSTSFQ